VVGGGFDTASAPRPRAARGRPNWWVILAVSLALMALLVATAGTAPHPSGHDHPLADHAASDAGAKPGAASSGASRPRALGGSATTTTSTTSAGLPASSSRSLLAGHSLVAGIVPTTVPPSVTTTIAASPTTSTTVGPPPAVPSDRTVAQGYLDPPLQTSNGYGFTGTGAMEVSVEWSGSTYLTMTVGCPNGSQSVGGTSAMAASLPNASGSCRATVSEPASETSALTYTITIGPAGG
jgi:hypothetical protein